MTMRESDIMFECGNYWVARDREYACHTVYKTGITHSKADCGFPLDDDGLSLAICRAKYLASRA